MATLIVLLLVGPLLLWGAVDPASFWWATESWRHAHPDEHLPSAQQLMVRRGVALAGAVTVVAVGFAA